MGGGGSGPSRSRETSRTDRGLGPGLAEFSPAVIDGRSPPPPAGCAAVAAGWADGRCSGDGGLIGGETGGRTAALMAQQQQEESGVSAP